MAKVVTDKNLLRLVDNLQKQLMEHHIGNRRRALELAIDAHARGAPTSGSVVSTAREYADFMMDGKAPKRARGWK